MLLTRLLLLSGRWCVTEAALADMPSVWHICYTQGTNRFIFHPKVTATEKSVARLVADEQYIIAPRYPDKDHIVA